MAQSDPTSSAAGARGALSGLRVIDFGQYLAGPLAAMLLADNGAEVIRIDPPGGPRWKSPANAILQRGKRSIVLDLKQPADLKTARQLIASADVVIENFRPGVMDRLGVGGKAMTEAHPRLIYCSIPGFGEDDPRAGLQGWEPIVSAAAGLFRKVMLGALVHDPFYSPVPFASDYGALIAAHGIMAALIGRHHHGLGQRIEAPLFEAAFQVMGYSLQQVGDTAKPFPRPKRNPAFREVLLCGDGRYIFFTPPFAGRTRFIEELMTPEIRALVLKDDPESQDRMRVLLKQFFAAHTAREWEEIGQTVGAGIAVIQTSEDWMRDEHALAARAVIALDDPELGPTRQAGHAIEMDRTPPREQGPRHRLDADRQAILEDLAARAAPSPAPAAGALRAPLAGVRIVDTTQVLAGPTATRVLAEYGAEVIKINNPRPENINSLMGHATVNAGKRSILLDLKAAEGKDILRRIIETSDIFHQNFAQGVAERLGLGEADVRAMRPDIVYSTINTHANGGFRAKFRGHEQLGQAVTGMALIHEDPLGPAAAGWPVNDHCTGHMSAFAMLLALYHRLQTGEGQHVRASLSGSATFMMTPFMISYRGADIRPPMGGGQRRGAGPLDRLYEVADGWIYLHAAQAGDLGRLAAVRGLEGIEAAEPETLEADLERRFKVDTRQAWVERLTAAGVPAHAHANWEETIDGPIHRARGIVVDRDHPGLGKVRRIASTVRLSRTPLADVRPAPTPGWDTEEVLETFGYAGRFEALVGAGVAGGPQPAD